MIAFTIYEHFWMEHCPKNQNFLIKRLKDWICYKIKSFASFALQFLHKSPNDNRNMWKMSNSKEFWILTIFEWLSGQKNKRKKNVIFFQPWETFLSFTATVPMLTKLDILIECLTRQTSQLRPLCQGRLPIAGNRKLCFHFVNFSGLIAILDHMKSLQKS